MADLTFRRMKLELDRNTAFDNYRNACISSFGANARCCSREHYLKWLGERIEEFPDGNVMATLNGSIIGQMELQIPYGRKTGYVNLFYVAPAWRRLGMGRRLHEYAERYFRSWEADAVELHVSSTNTAAMAFYRSLGYRTILDKNEPDHMRKMRREITVARCAT